MSATSIRILSAATLASILLLIFYFFNKNGLLVISMILTAGGIYEYNKLGLKSVGKLTSLLFCVLCYSLYYVQIYSPERTSFLFIAASLSFILIYLVSEKNKSLCIPTIGGAIIGFVYVGLLPGLFTQFFLFSEDGLVYFLFCLVAVISTDVFAYFIGKQFGKTPLMPEVSPNKTVEGACAGLVAAVLCGIGVIYLVGWSSNIFPLTATFFFASLFGQFGDLFESQLKRDADVKDSGSLMPGHGGILDRLDSLLFAAPVFYCYAIYLQ